MTKTSHRRGRLGLGAALVCAAGLAACGGDNGPTSESEVAAILAEAGVDDGQAAAPAGELTETESEASSFALDTAEGFRILSAEKRVAFMTGHVEAGLALYRAGFPGQAARQLQLPVSEIHPTEREDMNALGLDPNAFLLASEALEAGKPAEEVDPLIATVNTNLAELQQTAGGDPVDIVLFLLEVCVEDYQAGVLDAGIRMLGNYQDAYGFAVAARDYAARIEGPDTSALMLELELLVRMWPGEGPVETDAVAPVPTIATQVARAKLELSVLE